MGKKNRTGKRLRLVPLILRGYGAFLGLGLAVIGLVEIKEGIGLSFAISNKIDVLMQERGLSKKQLADQLGKRPSEITRWLSGQHNFTVSTLAMLSTFFGKSIISV